jgi:flagellar protein FlgJ
VARQAEALFLGELLKTLRSSGFGPGLLDGPQAEMYRDLLHRQLAMDLSQHGGLGFAQSLVGALGGDAASPSLSTASLGGLPRGVSTLPPVGRPPAAASVAGGYESPAAFVTDLWPHAQRVGQALGIDGRVILAQAALETGWGERMARTPDGRPSHNLFGIKAHGWGGAVTTVPTLEFRDGALQREVAQFRAYPSPAEAFDDYLRFLTDNPRYRQALAAGDAAGFARGLQAAGYATDPGYADKILGVMASPLLADLDDEASSGARA